MVQARRIAPPWVGQHIRSQACFRFRNQTGLVPTRKMAAQRLKWFVVARRVSATLNAVHRGQIVGPHGPNLESHHF
jgi:hypothetical protein